jgi:LPS-assembly protein
LAAGAAIVAVGVPLIPALAQSLGPLVQKGAPAPDQPMLLEADQLLYDFDREIVTAVGNVKIHYGVSYLDAAKVTYYQKSGRLIASGGVRILDPDGNLVTSESADITDDFRDGFVQSLNVITTERAHISAQTGERRDGNLLIFRKGVYTACQACLSHPDKPPLWQIKAARIIHDRTERTIYFYDARLEFLGIPIAYVPVFWAPDPTVKRKTGFLTPSFRAGSATGFGVTTPFYWSIAPDYDVTFSPTYLTEQGLLMETEWRQRLMNGSYSIRLAGIFQQDPGAFVDDNGNPLSGDRDFRGSVRTKGSFAINTRWTYGWDLNAITDRTFNRDYRIAGSTAQDLTSTVYLTGLSDRNFFDLRGYYFNVQRENTEETLSDGSVYVHDDQAEQAVAHPVMDYNYILGQPVLGGELRFDSNLQSLSRDESDIQHPPDPFSPYYAGVAGDFARATSRATWERRFVGPLGQVITPFSYVQADLNWVDADDSASGLGSDEAIGRAMPAVGIEYEWPFLVTAGAITQTIGPKAQIIARPNEQHVGDLPNDDSQSLVFDDTSLFVLDKFSGYDREEGGTRANVGLVYQGLLPNGASIDALVGQSYQLAGENSFAMEGQGLTGVGSGLDTDISDYVGRVTFNTGTGLALTARARLDEADFTMNTGSLNALGTYEDTIASLGYAYTREDPSAGIYEQRQELSAAASLAVSDNWSVLGSLVYDIENGSPVKESFGLAYADDCLQVSAVYSETPEQYSDLVTGREVFVRLSLRTLGNNQLPSLLNDSVN